MKHQQYCIVCLLLVLLLVVVDSNSVTAQSGCLDVGTYEVMPDRHMASHGLGWVVCAAYVEPPPFDPNLLTLVSGPLLWPDTGMCIFEEYCVIECQDSSLTLDYDPNTPIVEWMGFYIYITGFTGKVLTNQSFQITLDYFWDCPCSVGCGCWFLGGDASGSFTFTGTIPSVPAQETTWGQVKALYR